MPFLFTKGITSVTTCSPHNWAITDLTDGTSLEKVKKWTEELHENEKDCIVFIVGTKGSFFSLITCIDKHESRVVKTVFVLNSFNS